MRQYNAERFPVYDYDGFFGEISIEELEVFLGDKSNPESIYYHKLSFDLGTAMTMMGKAKVLNNNGEADRWRLVPLKNRVMKPVVVAVLALVLLLGAGLLWYPDKTNLTDQWNRVPDLQVIKAPKGMALHLTLPDGSQVWLNSASSLSYRPNLGKMPERCVTLSGEAYFEVVKTAKRSTFNVVTDRQRVEVLGTRFNVKAYPDEEEIKTTLIEGAVRVVPQLGREALLKPDEQAVLSGGKLHVQGITASDAVAWKDGEFIFRDESLVSVMHILSRWYDKVVVYKGVYPDRILLGGSFSRNNKLADVLKILEISGGVNFETQGNQITVTPR